MDEEREQFTIINEKREEAIIMDGKGEQAIIIDEKRNKLLLKNDEVREQSDNAWVERSSYYI